MKGHRITTHPAGAFKTIAKAWEVIFYSLVLDALLFLTGYAPLSAQESQKIAILCALVTLPFMNQRIVIRTLTEARQLQRNFVGRHARLPRVALGFGIAALITIKVLLLPSLNNSVSIIFAMIVVLGILTSVSQMVRESHQNSQALKESPWLYIRLWERQLVAIFCIPMIAARSISTLGTLSNQPFVLTATFFFISLILLLLLRPYRNAFSGWCKTCKAPTLVAFAEYGSCPQCDKNLMAPNNDRRSFDESRG